MIHTAEPPFLTLIMMSLSETMMQMHEKETGGQMRFSPRLYP